VSQALREFLVAVRPFDDRPVMSADCGSGSRVGGAVGQHCKHDLLVLRGGLETILQPRSLELAFVIEWLLTQPLHHPLDRRVPVGCKLGVATAPVIQRFDAYVSGHQMVLVRYRTAADCASTTTQQVCKA